MTTQTTHATRPTLPVAAAFSAAIVSMTAFFLAAGAPTPLLIVEQEHWGFPSSLLTLAFGIYAIGLLATLLTAGRLSDYVGRRPVLIAALLLETGAFILMLTATNIETVIIGRLIQGIATGAATSAFSSAVIELAPPRAKRIAASIVSAAPAAGLGLGALVAGAMTSTITNAGAVIWAGLAVVTTLGAVAVVVSPETVARRAGAFVSLRPKLSIQPAVRAVFRNAVPILVAAWMMAALFMGLVPTTLGVVFHIQNTFVDGATAFLEPAAAAAATLLTTRLAPRILLRVAASTTIAGAAVFLAGLLSHQLWVLDAAGITGGIGFGTAMAGTIRSTVPATPAEHRAGIFAAIYTVSYLAFGIPAIASGIVIGVAGLTPVIVGLVSVIGLLGAVGLVTTTARAPRTAHIACAA